MRQEAAQGNPALTDSGCGRGRPVLDRHVGLYIRTDLFYKQRKHPLVFCDRGRAGTPRISAVCKVFSENRSRIV